MEMMQQIENLKQALPKLGERDKAFAQSLLAALARWRSLSNKQMFWVNELIKRANNPKPEPAQVGDLAPILSLFEKAGAKLKHPAIVLSTPETGALRVTVAGQRSKYPGTLSITGLGTFDSRAWFGRVNKDGTFTAGRDAAGKEAPLTGLLRRFAAEPAKVAGEHGRVTGCCCFCNRALDDKRSVAVGYGPVCAENYGLTW